MNGNCEKRKGRIGEPIKMDAQELCKGCAYEKRTGRILGEGGPKPGERTSHA